MFRKNESNIVHCLITGSLTPGRQSSLALPASCTVSTELPTCVWPHQALVRMRGTARAFRVGTRCTSTHTLHACAQRRGIFGQSRVRTGLHPERRGPRRCRGASPPSGTASALKLTVCSTCPQGEKVMKKTAWSCIRVTSFCHLSPGWAICQDTRRAEPCGCYTDYKC